MESKISNEPELSEKAVKKQSKLTKFILSHKLVFSLLLLILILIGGFYVKIVIMQSQFEKQKTAIENNYESKIDSLTTKQLALTSKVFSWAVRGELLRQNNDQINQYFSAIIQENGIQKVIYIDAETHRIILSTDKKDVGMISNNSATLADKPIHFKKDSTIEFYAPVMDLNNKLGTLEIVFSK
jgi:hypothetical protein